MSKITYQVETVLPDKLLMANQVLLSFAEINKLRKQGMTVNFILNTVDITEKITARCDFYQWSVDYKPDRDFDSLVQKQGLAQALLTYKKRYVAHVLRHNKMDLKKTAKLLQIENSSLKNQISELGFNWSLLED